MNPFADYRFIFHQMYGNGYKIKGCTILETEPLRVFKAKSSYISNFIYIKSAPKGDNLFQFSNELLKGTIWPSFQE